MKTPVYTNRFERGLKLMLRRGKDAEKFKTLARLLLAGGVLPPRYRHHPLKGGFVGWRDCHLEPDWVLVYKITNREIVFGRTGTHSDFVWLNAIWLIPPRTGGRLADIAPPVLHFMALPKPAEMAGERLVLG